MGLKDGGSVMTSSPRQPWARARATTQMNFRSIFNGRLFFSRSEAVLESCTD